MFTLGILTCSDAGSKGMREDTSGMVIQELLTAPQYDTVRYDLVPDELDLIQNRLTEWCDSGDVDVIMTTGGTGLGVRDVTPEATVGIIERPVPGLPEAMRQSALKDTPFAMLSRGIAGVRGRTLVVNLPGSPKGVRQSLEVIIGVLPHALELIKDLADGHPQ